MGWGNAMSGAGSGAMTGMVGGPWGAAAGAGIGFLGGLLSNRGKKATQTTAQTDSPEAASLNALMLNMMRERLSTPPDMTGIRTQGIQDINSTFGNVQTGMNANLTARGLSDSPAAGAPISRLEGARGGSIAQLINSLPMMQRQMQNQDMQAGASVYGAQPRTTTTTAEQPGDMLGGGVSSLGTMLSYLYGSGAFQRRPGGTPAYSGAGSPFMAIGR